MQQFGFFHQLKQIIMFEDHKNLYEKLLAVKMKLIGLCNTYLVLANLYLSNKGLDDNTTLA
jgi:hypothetical protein